MVMPESLYFIRAERGTDYGGCGAGLAENKIQKSMKKLKLQRRMNKDSGFGASTLVKHLKK